MKKRVLLPSGRFANYRGKREKVKVKKVEEKVAERKQADSIAAKHGVDVEKPADGNVLSEADVSKLKEGMKLTSIVTLANLRGIEIPEEMETKEEMTKFLLEKAGASAGALEEDNGLSADDVHAIKKMSVPEMKAYAKENEIKIPSKLSKKADIMNFLLGGEEESAADDL